MRTSLFLMVVASSVFLSNPTFSIAQLPQGFFTEARPVPGLDSPDRDGRAFETDDGLNIYFTSNRKHEPEETWSIYSASRKTASEPFADAVELELHIDGVEQPEIHSPHLSADGKRIYWSAAPADFGNLTEHHIFTSNRALQGDEFVDVVAMHELRTDSREFSPSLTADELMVVFEYDGHREDPDIYQATRTSITKPFGQPEPIESLSTPGNEAHPSISADGLTLFYSVPGLWEIRVASRSSRTEPFGQPRSLSSAFPGTRLSGDPDVNFFPSISHDWPEHGAKLYFTHWNNDGDWDIHEATWMAALKSGDADQDFDFDQLDLVHVQINAKYLTGEPATWGEGDWNGAPGGTFGSPPAGDGIFNQLDIVSAQQAGGYLSGPYATIQPNGQQADVQTSVIYNADTGELAVDAPAGVELTSINIDSATGIFTGEAAANLGGSFDNDADTNIFKATFGGRFGSISFGNVAQDGLSEEFVLGDLSVVGSLAGGGDLGDVDLVYMPEPAAALLLALGLSVGLTCIRHR